MATAERITAPLIKKALDEHLQKHELKYDVKLHDVHAAVFGEHKDDGMISEIDDLQHSYKDIERRLTKIESSINWGVLVVLGSFLAAVANLVMK